MERAEPANLQQLYKRDDRGHSQICRLEHVASCGIIAPRRMSSAHLRRPWRATRKSTPRRAMDPARVRLYAVVRRSGRLRDVVQDEQVRALAGRDRVGATLVVAELHEQRLVI